MAAIQPNQLSEHESVIEAPPSTQYSQSSEEESDVKMVLDLLDQGKKAKQEISQDWDLYQDFYDGKQFKNARNPYKSKISINVIKMTIQTILPILTDAKPGFNIIPREPSDFNFATILNEVIEGWWDDNDMNQTIIEALMDAMILSGGILKVIWDEDANEGIGDIKVDVIDPADIYVPFDSRDFDKNCPWVIQLINKPVGELRRLFPEHSDVIKPDNTSTSSNSPNTEVTVTSPIDKASINNFNPKGSNEDDRKTALIAECWMDDNSLEEYIETSKDDNGNDIQIKKMKKKYPKGKVITVLVNQRVRLQGVENPYKHAKKPFVRVVDKIKSRQFWGEGEAEPLMDVQKAINKTISNILDYMNFTSNPIWVNESDSGVDVNKITNTYGLILTTSPGGMGKIKRDIPPPLPQYMSSLYETLIRASEAIGGAQEISQGRRPTGVTSGDAIETLQEAANTRIRLKERNLQTSLSQMGRLIISLIMQFYKEPRVTKITGKEGFPKYFEFYVEDIDNDNVKFNKKEYTFDRGKNKYMEGQIIEGSPSKGMFDVKVLSGTSLPFAKAQRMNIAFKLLDRQIIDAEEMLKTVEWPNSEKIMERIKSQQPPKQTGE